MGKTYKGEIDFGVISGKKKCFIQAAYYLSGNQTIEREFGAFKPISDALGFWISNSPMTTWTGSIRKGIKN